MTMTISTAVGVVTTLVITGLLIAKLKGIGEDDLDAELDETTRLNSTKEA
ncbi:hypothetical protein SNR37_003292 [Agarivorans aestuarii]|uniref:Uncharacterized protein n=1 Tax=Agarivorans aestuarii TaxID=1563703 RepID=A0ABU7G3K0_9ALTE|nr:hypothetical protein [Agarivorans aestuarii]MEE1673865.1 hypothetical protein [Agarivorans aestuarii]